MNLPVDGESVVADAAAAAAAGKYEAVAAAAKKSAGDNGEYLDGRIKKRKNSLLAQKNTSRSIQKDRSRRGKG